tara:strand:- start:2057 stop:2617 length:561 start_codon:yes stop_codon:yes gene_type:complete
MKIHKEMIAILEEQIESITSGLIGYASDIYEKAEASQSLSEWIANDENKNVTKEINVKYDQLRSDYIAILNDKYKSYFAERLKGSFEAEIKNLRAGKYNSQAWESMFYKNLGVEMIERLACTVNDRVLELAKQIDENQASCLTHHKHATTQDRNHNMTCLESPPLSNHIYELMKASLQDEQNVILN